MDITITAIAMMEIKRRVDVNHSGAPECHFHVYTKEPAAGVTDSHSATVSPACISVLGAQGVSEFTAKCTCSKLLSVRWQQAQAAYAWISCVRKTIAESTVLRMYTP